MSDYSKTHWMKDLPDTPTTKHLFNPQGGCVKGREIWGASLPQNYQPETVSIPKLEVENIIDALKAGLEHTENVLIDHDNTLGRTTRKNELWAKQLEKDIEFFKTRIKLLKEKLGTTNHQS